MLLRTKARDIWECDKCGWFMTTQMITDMFGSDNAFTKIKCMACEKHDIDLFQLNEDVYKKRVKKQKISDKAESMRAHVKYKNLQREYLKANQAIEHLREQNQRISKEIEVAMRVALNRNKAIETVHRFIRSMISLLKDDILDPQDRIEMATKDVAYIGLLLKNMTTGLSWDQAIAKYGEKAVEKGQEELQDMIDHYDAAFKHLNDMMRYPF